MVISYRGGGGESRTKLVGVLLSVVKSGGKEEAGKIPNPNKRSEAAAQDAQRGSERAQTVPASRLWHVRFSQKEQNIN